MTTMVKLPAFQGGGSLKWRLGVPLLAGVFLTSAIPTAVTYVLVRGHLTREAEERALAIAEGLGALARYAIVTEDHESLGRLVDGALEGHEVAWVRVYDAQGKELAGKERADRTLERPIEVETAVFEDKEDDFALGLIDEEAHAPARLGAVRIGLSRQSLHAGLADLLRTGAAQAGLLLVLGLMGVAAVMRLVVKPVLEVSAAAERIARGDLRSRASVERDDEIGRLASSFNHMAEELIRQKTWLDRILQTVPDPLVVIDRFNSMLKVNTAFESATGKRASQLLGRPLTGLVEGHGKGVLEQALATAKEGVRFEDPSCVLHGVDGRAIPVFLSAAVMPEGGRVLVLKDLTELRGVQEDLVRSTRLAAVGEVAGYAAHEVLNPVTSLLGRLHRMERHALEVRADHLEVGRAIVGGWRESLQDGGPEGLLRSLMEPGEGGVPLIEEDLVNVASILDHYEGDGLKLKDDLDFMKRELERVASIVDGMRTLSRRKQTVEDLDLRRIVGEAVETQTDAIHKRGIRLSWDLPAAPVLVRVDKNEVVQALTNLLRNAVQAIDGSSGGGSIAVSVAAEGGKARVGIVDDGCGMAAEVVPFVFEAGFTTKAAAEGTGLGLGLCRRFIRSFGGDVEVGRTAPGSGTEMVLTLPLAAGSAASEPAAEAASEPAAEAASEPAAEAA